MYTEALKGSQNIMDLYSLYKWKRQYKKEHPFEFKPIGTMMFCSYPGQRQGNGKTLSAVSYILNVLKVYPFAILVSNCAIKDYPFNAHYIVDNQGTAHIIDNLTGEEITSKDIINGKFTKVCIEYDGPDCFKFISNGEYGVIYFVDEIHFDFNCKDSKNLEMDIVVEISQQRKQRKHVVGTSQVFMQLAKAFRQQIFDVVMCKNYFSCIQVNKTVNVATLREVNGNMVAETKKTFVFFHTKELYQMYDTYSKIKRQNKNNKAVFSFNVERSD